MMEYVIVVALINLTRETMDV